MGQSDQSKRLEECVAMRIWLRTLQIDDEPDVDIFKKKMLDFVKTGTPSSGTFFVEKIGKKVAYMLSNRTESRIGLVR